MEVGSHLSVFNSRIVQWLCSVKCVHSIVFVQEKWQKACSLLSVCCISCVHSVSNAVCVRLLIMALSTVCLPYLWIEEFAFLKHVPSEAFIYSSRTAKVFDPAQPIFPVRILEVKTNIIIEWYRPLRVWWALPGLSFVVANRACAYPNFTGSKQNLKAQNILRMPLVLATRHVSVEINEQ